MIISLSISGDPCVALEESASHTFILLEGMPQVGYIVLCVVVFSLLSYRLVTVLHVVSRCCSGYVHA